MSNSPVILIGEAKCGTTSIHKYLIQHPNLSNSPKETCYFYKTNNPTHEQFYKTLFYQKSNEIHPLDVSQNYFRTPNVEKKIFNLFPDAKLILMLRHPTQRAYSNFWMNKRQHKHKHSFEEIMHQYLEGQISKYTENLKRWLKYFPREQIFFVKSEDFYNNESDEVNNLFKRMGLSEINVKKIKPIIPHCPTHTGIPEKHYPEINKNTKDYCDTFFSKEIQEFEELMGKKIWSE